ncbi:MAG: hypothetical protein HYZ22_09205 [Chloroflexi bacterium]|nr:hypothetical protein [Chloroflexota bacterium]
MTGTNAAAGVTQSNDMDANFAMYGVTFDGSWTSERKQAVARGVQLVGDRFATEIGNHHTATSAFRSIYDEGVNFTWGSEHATGDCAIVMSGGCTSNGHQINFWSMAGDGDDMFAMTGNVIHELGHAYNNGLGKAPEKDLAKWTNWTSIVLNRRLILRTNPECDDCYYWQFNRDMTATETFADMFVAWTYDAWNTSTDPKNVLAVDNAQSWLNNWLPHNP